MAKKYKATNVGGLMVEDSAKVFAYLYKSNQQKIDPAELSAILPIKSESSRKRIFNEIQKRYNQIPPTILEFFLNGSENEQKVILYYASLKLYNLLFDLVFEQLIPKHQRGESTLQSFDVLSFFDSKETQQPEISNWSIRTRKNMVSILLMMLREVGILNKNQIQPINLNSSVWKLWVNQNEAWMLDAALFTKDKKEKVLNQ